MWVSVLRDLSFPRMLTSLHSGRDFCRRLRLPRCYAYPWSFGSFIVRPLGRWSSSPYAWRLRLWCRPSPTVRCLSGSCPQEGSTGAPDSWLQRTVSSQAVRWSDSAAYFSWTHDPSSARLSSWGCLWSDCEIERTILSHSQTSDQYPSVIWSSCHLQPAAPYRTRASSKY